MDEAVDAKTVRESDSLVEAAMVEVEVDDGVAKKEASRAKRRGGNRFPELRQEVEE